MRFTRYQKHAFVWSHRKELAVVRRMRLEREAYPLFSDQIEAVQLSVEQVHEMRVVRAAKSELDFRQYRARAWRELRLKVAAVPALDRPALLRYWNEHRHFPGTPIYLAFVLRQYRDGGLTALGQKK